MKNVTKRIHFLMTKKDEELFEIVLKDLNCNIKYLDDNIWDKPVPLIKDKLSDCNSKFVYIWDGKKFPKIPIVEKNGKFHGPQTAMVLQMERSQLKDNLLISGVISTRFISGGDEDDMRLIWPQIWKVIKKFGNNKLKCIDIQTGETLNENVNDIYVFPDAIEFIKLNKIEFYKHLSAQLYFTIKS